MGIQRLQTLLHGQLIIFTVKTNNVLKKIDDDTENNNDPGTAALTQLLMNRQEGKQEGQSSSEANEDPEAAEKEDKDKINLIKWLSGASGGMACLAGLYMICVTVYYCQV